MDRIKEVWWYIVGLWGATIGNLSFCKAALVYFSLILVILNIYYRVQEYKRKMKDE